VFPTNSVHGILSVRSLGGTQAAWPAGPVTARLRDALARSAARTWDADHAPSRPASLPRQQAAQRGHDGAAGPAIILVDNYDSFTYNLAHLLLRSGCQVEVVRNDAVAAQDIANFRPDGIVISPGPGGPADAGISIETVRVCGPVTPLLGICLGHQAIAAAVGGRITRARQPVHGQASAVTHDGHGVLAGLPQHFPAARYHSLIIDEDSLPSVLQVTARGPGGIPMGLRHSQHPVEGLQFHPESILTTHGHTIISNFVRAARGRV
jgi:para-aminobenzoate synthetase / 4-amino-4-deoxychorismate lyase